MPRAHYRLHGSSRKRGQHTAAPRMDTGAACGGSRLADTGAAGSALYTLASIFGIEGGDSVRAAAQICTGVGFIGAGVIAKGGGKSPVRGVTTASSSS